MQIKGNQNTYIKATAGDECSSSLGTLSERVITGNYIVTDQQSKIDNMVMLYDIEHILPDVNKNNAHLFMDACIYYNNIALADSILEKFTTNIYWYKTFRKLFKVGTIDMVKVVAKHADITEINHTARSKVTYNILFAYLFRVDHVEKIDLIIKSTLDKKVNPLQLIYKVLKNKNGNRAGYPDIGHEVGLKIIDYITEEHYDNIILKKKYIGTLHFMYHNCPEKTFEIVKRLLATDINGELRSCMLISLRLSEDHYIRLLKKYIRHNVHYLPHLISFYEHYGIGNDKAVRDRLHEVIFSYVRLGRSGLVEMLYNIETMRYILDWKFLVYLIHIYKKGKEYDFMKDMFKEHHEVIGLSHIDKKVLVGIAE